jgi:hypothetical protein
LQSPLTPADKSVPTGARSHLAVAKLESVKADCMLVLQRFQPPDDFATALSLAADGKSEYSHHVMIDVLSAIGYRS